MNAELTIKLGDKLLKISGGPAKDTEIVKAIAFWSQLPTICTNCNSSNVSLMYKSPKDNDYYGLKCMDCGAELTFHQYKAGGFYLTREDTYKVFKQQALPTTTTPPQIEGQKEDIPF